MHHDREDPLGLLRFALTLVGGQSPEKLVPKYVSTGEPPPASSWDEISVTVHKRSGLLTPADGATHTYIGYAQWLSFDTM